MGKVSISIENDPSWSTARERALAAWRLAAAAAAIANSRP